MIGKLIYLNLINMSMSLVITPEEFDRYEYDLNHVQAKEVELEQQAVQDFLDFIEECNKEKGLPF
jgi:hypothetical protein